MQDKTWREAFINVLDDNAGYGRESFKDTIAAFVFAAVIGVVFMGLFIGMVWAVTSGKDFTSKENATNYVAQYGLIEAVDNQDGSWVVQVSKPLDADRTCVRVSSSRMKVEHGRTYEEGCRYGD